MFLTSVANWLRKEWGKSRSLPPTLISRIKIAFTFFFPAFRISVSKASPNRQDKMTWDNLVLCSLIPACAVALNDFMNTDWKSVFCHILSDP